MKNKKLIVLVVVLAVVGFVIGIFAGSYNKMVTGREEVENKFSTVETMLQRRFDLIPNLVSAVKGYTDYEQSTYTAVTQARANYQGAYTTNEKVEAADELSGALNVWVNAVTEAYPDLKANEQFKTLTDELSGSENRIAVARKDYNDAAKNYNTSIKKFPRNIFASIFGFEAYDYFEATDGAENVPQVSFD